MAVIVSKLIVALVDQLTAPARGVARVVKDLQTASRANAMQMNEMRGRMVDAAVAAYTLGRALMDPVGKAVAFESAMADVAKVSDFDPAGLKEFSRDLRRLSTSDIPMAATELAALAENAAAAGVAETDLLDFTQGTAKAALAWDMTGAQAGEDLAKIREALRLSTPDVMLYADAINHLSDRTASTAPDLTDFARRVAVQGEFFGFTKEESLAFGSAMISAGAETEVAATSFRNMGRSLTKGAAATARVKGAYRTLGLEAGAVAKAMQEDAVGTTQEVIRRLGQLPAHMQAAVTSDLFGDEARALTPLLSNADLLDRTLAHVADTTAYAGSVQAEFATRAATSEFTLQRLKNQIDDVAMSIGNALLPVINAAAAAFGPWLMALSEWISANPQAVQAIVTLVAGLVAMRVAVLAARWAFLFMKGGVIETLAAFAGGGAKMLALLNPLNLVKNAVMALRLVLMASGIGLLLAAIAMAGTWIYNNWDGLVAFFQGFGSGLVAAMAPIMPVIQPVIDAGAKIMEWVTGLVGPVDASQAQWTNWGESAGRAVGGAVMAVVTKGQEIIDWFKGLPSAISAGVTGMVETGSRIMQGIYDGILAKFQEMLAWFGSWPDLILQAIGQIDLSSLFRFPDLGAMFGGGQQSGPHVVQPGDVAPGGKVIGGAFAAGGHIRAGMTALVGENGPELITASRSGWVHNADQTARIIGGSAGGASGMPSISVSIGDIIIPASQDPAATAEAVLNMLQEKLQSALGGLYANLEFGG